MLDTPLGGILDCHEDPSVIIGRQHRAAAKWYVTAERGVKSVFVATLHKQTGVAVTDRILEKITVPESGNARGKAVYDIPTGHVAAASDIDSSATHTIGVNNLIVSHFRQCSPDQKDAVQVISQFQIPHNVTRIQLCSS
jgi:hypothetical protein